MDFCAIALEVEDPTTLPVSFLMILYGRGPLRFTILYGIILPFPELGVCLSKRFPPELEEG